MIGITIKLLEFTASNIHVIMLLVNGFCVVYEYHIMLGHL